MHERLPWSLSRRIDKLALRAHAFHRFAHHPLCGRYESEVLRVGKRVRLCRGCTFTIAAGVLGLALSWFVTLPRTALYALLLMAALVAVQSVLWPQALRLRLGKLGTRALPAFAGALSFGTSLSARHWDIAIAVATAFFVVRALYRRRGPDRSPCATCPEFGQPKTCSGFTQIVHAERAFMRRSQRLIDLDLLAQASSENPILAQASSENGVKFVSRS